MIHVTRPDADGVRRLYKKCSRRAVAGGRNYLGKVVRDEWCRHCRTGKIIGGGYYWTDLAEGFGKTFHRLRDCVADFQRELRDRRNANRSHR